MRVRYFSRDQSWTRANSTLVLALVIACQGAAFRLKAAQSGIIAVWGYQYSFSANVPTGLTNVLAVGIGSNHGLALRNDHTVVAWGNNTAGQLNIPPGLTNVVA